MNSSTFSQVIGFMQRGRTAQRGLVNLRRNSRMNPGKSRQKYPSLRTTIGNFPSLAASSPRRSRTILNSGVLLAGNDKVLLKHQRGETANLPRIAMSVLRHVDQQEGQRPGIGHASQKLLEQVDDAPGIVKRELENVDEFFWESQCRLAHSGLRSVPSKSLGRRSDEAKHKFDDCQTAGNYLRFVPLPFFFFVPPPNPNP